MYQTKLTTCASHERQLMVAISSYAADTKDNLPTGPSTIFPFDPTYQTRWCDFAGNWIWIAPPLGLGSGQYNAHGVLLQNYLNGNPKTMYCPGQDNPDTDGIDMNNIGSPTTNAFSGYDFRQLDSHPNNRLSDMGLDQCGLPAKAMIIDIARLSAMDKPATNHRAEKFNIAYSDGHVKTVDNYNNMLTIPASASAGFPDLTALLIATHQLLVNTDYTLIGDLKEAPTIP